MSEVIHRFSVPNGIGTIVRSGRHYQALVSITSPLYQQVAGSCPAFDDRGEACVGECAEGSRYCELHRFWDEVADFELEVDLEATLVHGTLQWTPATLGEISKRGIELADLELTPRFVFASYAEVTWLGAQIPRVMDETCKVVSSDFESISIKIDGLKITRVNLTFTPEGEAISVLAPTSPGHCDKSTRNTGLPEFGVCLLAFLLPDEILEATIGDFVERFPLKVEQMGSRGARIWFYRKAAESAWPYALSGSKRIAKWSWWLAPLIGWLFGGGHK